MYQSFPLVLYCPVYRQTQPLQSPSFPIIDKSFPLFPLCPRFFNSILFSLCRLANQCQRLFPLQRNFLTRGPYFLGGKKTPKISVFYEIEGSNSQTARQVQRRIKRRVDSTKIPASHVFVSKMDAFSTSVIQKNGPQRIDNTAF